MRPVDGRAHHERLSPGSDLLREALPYSVHPARLLRQRHDESLDSTSPTRQLGNGRHIQVTEDRHRHGSRYRCRGQHEYVWRHCPLLTQCLALLDTESVLLVDHHKTKVEELDGVTHESMRADDQLCLPGHRRQQCLAALGNRQLAGDQRWAEPGRKIRTQRLHYRTQVLTCQHFCWRKQRRLAAGVRHREHRPQRNHRLAGTNLALQKSVHRHRFGNVGRYRGSDRALVTGEFERQVCIKLGKIAALARHPRRCSLLAKLPALLQKCSLQHKCFMETQRLSRRTPVRIFLRSVDQLQRARIRQEAPCRADGVRDWIVQAWQSVEQHSDRLLHLPGCER